MNKTRVAAISFGLSALVVASGMAAAAGEDPTGVWLDQAGRGAVEIAPCGEGGLLCGRVVWVKSASHQKRCGEQILGSLKKMGNGTWSDGWIYSPDRGRKFDVELKPVGDDKLRIVGWAGIRMFSETHYWKRAAPDLARCGGEQTVAAKPKADVVAAAPQVPAPSVAGAPVERAIQGPAAARAPDSDATPASAPAASSTSTAEADRAAVDKKSGEKHASRGGGSNGLPSKVEKYFKRSADGTCKVDTPWIKVKFDCK